MIVLALLSARQAAAAPNSLRIEPSEATVAAGATAQVKLVVEPPPNSLAAWVIEVTFDPAVVTTTSRGCDPLDTPSGAVGAGGCVVVDANGDGSLDTAKMFGAVVYSGSGKGLSKQSTLADIVFTGAGGPGRCSTLKVTVKTFADPDGGETKPDVANGRLCMEGTPVPGETLPAGDTGGPSPSGASPGETPVAAGVTPAVGQGSAGSPGAADTPGAGSSLQTKRPSAQGSAGVSPGATVGQPGAGDDGSGGSNAAAWLLAGAGLAIVAGGVGAASRMRKRAQPNRKDG